MRIAICDDEKKWRDIAEENINSVTEYRFKISEFTGGSELIEEYKRSGNIFDIVFLDMEMQESTGIETANAIRGMDKHVIIIFVTSHSKYMQESFACMPFRFLIKPVNPEEFKEALLKAIDKISEDRQAVTFNENRATVRLLNEDIMFIQSVDHSVLIKCENELHTTRMKMNDLMQELNENVFIRVHKSYVVNMNYIKRMTRSSILLNSYQHEIPLSETYRSEAGKKFLLFNKRKYM